MSDTPVYVRFMQQDDIEEVLECEAKSHEYTDPDFKVPQLPGYAWSRDDILAAVKNGDNRALVAEILLPSVYESGEVSWVCGAMIFEIQQDGYEILLLTEHPDAPENIREALLDKLLSRAQKNEQRKRLSMVVPDGDYNTLGFLQKQGWTIKLVTNYWSNDEWHCEYRLPAADTPGPFSFSLT